MRASGSLHSGLKHRLTDLVEDLHSHPQAEQAADLLETVVAMSRNGMDPVDWEVVSSALADISDALKVFHPVRQQRKVAVFGSSQIAEGTPVYRQTIVLCRQLVAAGFDVMTGAGGGVMEAANCGAGPGNSFGLHMQLPFEFNPNPYIDCDNRLVTFRYFFTRKHFFLRESNAVVAMPGGFGTQDELFETLTLIQTAKAPPIPVVLLAPPEDRYWRDWKLYVDSRLDETGMLPFGSNRTYVVMDSVDAAVAHIRRFYRVLYRCTMAADRVQLLLHAPLSASQLQMLNRDFQDMLQSTIEQVSLPSPQGASPCLHFGFDGRYVGRLYALISRLNDLTPQGDAGPAGSERGQ